MNSSFLKLDLSVKNNIKDDLYEIYKHIRPNVSKDDLVIEKMSGGFVNLLHKVCTKNNPKDIVVFRTFEGNFDIDGIEKFFKKDENQEKEKNFKEAFFNRDNEIFYMDILSKYNLCEPVLVKYSNGVCFGFAKGVTSNGPLMLTNDYLEIMSKKLAKLHSVKSDLKKFTKTTHFELMNQYSSLSQSNLVDFFQKEIDQLNLPFNDFPKLSSIVNIEIDLDSKLKKIGFGEIGLGHNDLNQTNIIWDPQERDLKYIDFEQTMNSYIGYDIGYFYVSMVGPFLGEINEDFFPNNNYRLKFVRKYIEEKYKIENKKIDEKLFEDEVELLNIRSNIYALVFMTRLFIISLFFGFKPDLFRKKDSDCDIKENSINCAIYGYNNMKFLNKIKDELLKPYEEHFINEETK